MLLIVWCVINLIYLGDAAKIYAIFYILMNNKSVNIQRKLNFVYKKNWNFFRIILKNFNLRNRCRRCVE